MHCRECGRAVSRSLDAAVRIRGNRYYRDVERGIADVGVIEYVLACLIGWLCLDDGARLFGSTG